MLEGMEGESLIILNTSSSVKLPQSTDLGTAAPPPIITWHISWENAELTQDKRLGATTLTKYGVRHAVNEYSNILR
jgi:hypothetical protein